MSVPNTHNILILTRRAAALDAQGRYAEADRLDRIVFSARQGLAQWWNPVRGLKNWQNANEVNANQDNPQAVMRLMMLNMTKLYRDSQRQGFLLGLPDGLRPTVVRLLGECYQMLSMYAAQYGQTTHLQPTSAHDFIRTRTADLASGIDHDISDVVNLLSNLTGVDSEGRPLFPDGDKLFSAIQVRLRTVSNVLEGTTTAQQAEQQIPPPQSASTGQSVPSSPLPAVTPVTYQATTPAHSGYSQTGERYMGQTYQRALHQPGSPEWQNELQNALVWGQTNGGLEALLGKLQHDRHSQEFITAVQQVWQSQGLDKPAERMLP